MSFLEFLKIIGSSPNGGFCYQQFKSFTKHEEGWYEIVFELPHNQYRNLRYVDLYEIENIDFRVEITINDVDMLVSMKPIPMYGRHRPITWKVEDLIKAIEIYKAG